MLRGAPAGSLIRRPTLAVGRSGAFILGQDWPHNDGAPLPANPLVALGSDGNLGKPPGRFAYFSPKAVVDPAGVLHVLWAETSSSDSVRRTLGGRKLVSLWHATRSEAGWSGPVRVYASSGQLNWDDDVGSPIVARDGWLHAAVVEWAETDAVLHLAQSGRGWTAAHVPGTRHALYASLTTGPHGELVLAFIAPDPTIEHDAGSVFLTRSTDGGEHWSRPDLVSRSGRTQATSVRAVFAPDGTLHLLWGQNLTGGLVAEVVRHTVSRDQGRTWSPPDDLPTHPSYRSDLRAVSDRCSAIHVIYQDLHPSASPDQPGTERGELRYARWDHGWSAAESPLPSLNVIESDLASAGDGRVYLFMMARPVSDRSMTINFVPMIASVPVGARVGNDPLTRRFLP